MMEKYLGIMPIIIAVFAFFSAVTLIFTYRPAAVVTKVYVRVRGRLTEVKSGFFDYEKTDSFLLSHGACFHLGKKISPLRFLILRALVGLMMFTLGAGINMFFALILLVCGFFAPQLYLISANRRDNAGMTSQLRGLYNVLQEQIKAGVYVTDALAECHRGLPTGRLKKALEELSGEIMLRNSFTDAMQHLNDKFDNAMIDTLCIILIQAQESGQTVELLSDMSEQLKDLQAAELLKRKEKMDRTETFCILGIMAVMIGLIMFACIQTMMRTVTVL